MKARERETTQETPPQQRRSIFGLGERQWKRLSSIRRFFYYYGSLSTIAMAMLWLYVCMLILFCGGMLNCAIKVSRQERKARRAEADGGETAQ